MAALEQARAIAHRLPGVIGDTAFEVLVKGKRKGFAWIWMERVDPKKPRVPNFDVLAVRTNGADDKHAMIASNPDVYFTEPHYNGFPAVLVRLNAIELDELEEILIDAWRCLAPAEARKEYDARIAP